MSGRGEAIVLIQMRDGGGQGPDGGHGGGEEWLDSGSILQVDLMRFADGVAVEYEREESGMT